MDASVQVAVISASATVALAALSLFLTKRAERRDALQQRKLHHYQALLRGISDLAVDGIDKDLAHQRFARAVNTIALVAPQSVVSALMTFHNEVKFSNTSRTQEGHDKRLKELLVAIRRDLRLSPRDKASTFDFHLIGAAPPQEGPPPSSG